MLASHTRRTPIARFALHLPFAMAAAAAAASPPPALLHLNVTNSPLPRSSSSGRLYSSNPNAAEPELAAAAPPPPKLERDVPGSYGPPLLGVAKDRLNYFLLQGRDEFFKSLMKKHNTTVVRLNMPPGPPFFPDSRTIMCLDQQSVKTLFDSSKVEKRDVFAGTYMPSTGFTGGYRVLPYLDPSEPKHTLLKNFCFYLLKSNGPRWLPQFATAFGQASAQWEKDLAKSGEAKFVEVCQQFTFNFLIRSALNVDPSDASLAPSLGDKGPSLIQAWIGAQLAPQAPIGLPWPINELLHLIPIPPLAVSSQYSKLYKFFLAHSQPLLEAASEQFGLEKEEACHNLLFFICFNTWGGIQILFPTVVQRIGEAGLGLQKELAAEVREAVEGTGGGEITMGSLQRMELVHATVYEALRFDPPVPFQYGRARADMLVESHDAAFRVKKGELLASYQGIAMRDPRVFESPDAFKPHRFLGPEGRRLLESLTWSNGAETQQPSTGNKQCAGKDFVNLVTRLLLAHLFLRYDYFKLHEAAAGSGNVATPIKFSVLKKRKSADDAA